MKGTVERSPVKLPTWFWSVLIIGTLFYLSWPWLAQWLPVVD